MGQGIWKRPFESPLVSKVEFPSGKEWRRGELGKTTEEEAERGGGRKGGVGGEKLGELEMTMAICYETEE